jgi:phosphate-selective porin
MKTITYIVALVLGLAFSATAFAADVTTAKTKAECHKAGGTWDVTAKTCKANSGSGY